jgi:tetratricopeptide (TPR) repeat protein
VLVGGAAVARLPFIAMELVRGAPITTHVAMRRASIEERVELFARVCDAVEAAHAAGVIHCDLKPSNVLVVGDTGEPRVLDFGVARLVGDRVDAAHTTVVGSLVGALAYMRPEQSAGRRDALDARTDVYALGVVLDELLTGRLPIDVAGLSFAAAARLVEEAEPVRAELVEPRLRGDLTVILGKALEKDPAARFASAGALARDLRRHLAGEPIEARPLGLSDRARRAARRHQTLVAAVGAALATGIVVLVIGMLRTMRERDRAVAAFDRAAASESAAVQAKEEAEEVARLFVGALLTTDPSHGGGDMPLSRFLENVDGVLAERTDLHVLTEARLRLALGHAWYATGNLARARRSIDRTLEVRERDLGPDHVDTWLARAELTLIEAAEGDLVSAETLLRGALSRFEPDLGTEHNWHDEARTRLVGVLVELGRHVEAEVLSRAGVEYRRRTRGPDAHMTIDAEMGLAGIWTTLGRLDEARPLLELGLDVLPREKSADHRWTIDMAQALAQLESVAEHHELAVALQLRAVDALQCDLGAQHPATLHVRRRLAGYRWESGQHDEAIAVSRVALAGTEAALGPRHPGTIAARGNLGSMLLAEQHFEEAEPLLAEAADAALESSSVSRAMAGHFATRHGIVLLHLGRVEESERQLVRAYQTLLASGTTADDSVNVRDAARNLARICGASGRIGEERAWLYRARRTKPAR